MDKRGKRWGAVLGAGTLLAVVPSTAPARADLLVAGVCRLTVSAGTLTTAPPVAVSTVSIGGNGPCWVAGDPGGPFTGTLSGTLTGAFGCFSGAAAGTGTFTLARSGFPGDLTLTVATAAAGVLLAAGAEVRFVGGGAFAPDVGPAYACTSGPTVMSWTGKFAFEQATAVGDP